MSDNSVLIASTSGQAGISSGFDLVTQVCRPVGGEGENAIRAQGLDCLNRVRRELNQHDWTFMKTTDDPITLVNGTDTYTLASTFRKPSYAFLIDAAAVPTFALRYIDDETFQDAAPYPMSEAGQPCYYRLRNDFEDGLITLYPAPDATTAANSRLVVEYYGRIGAFADDTDPIDLPEEVVNVLIIGGQAYILREREKASPAAMQAFADFQRVKMLLMSDDRRVADEKPRFKLGGKPIAPFGTMYIRV